MPNYVYDNTALFFPKTDLDPIPGGADPTKYVQAVDWNTLNQAVDDIKGVLRSAVWIGLNDQISDPLPSGISTYLWLTTTNVLNLKNGGTNYPIVLGTRLISAGTGLSGGGDLSADRTLSLANTAVTPGSYTLANITVDAQGRITSASNGTGAVPTSRLISTGTGLSGGGDLSADRTISLANTAVSPGSYTFANITVDAQGRLTAATTGGVGSILASSTVGSVLFVNTGGILDQDNSTFFWDSSTKRLGIGNAAPGVSLDVTGTIRASAGITLSTMTLGSVLFAGASGAITQDNTYFTWNDTNNYLAAHTNHATDGSLFVRSTVTTGPSALGTLDSTGAFKSYWGYFNSAYGYTYMQNKSGVLSFGGENIIFGNATIATHEFGMTANSLFFEMFNGGSAAVSSANSGRLRYNTTGQKFQISANAAAYVDLVTQVAAAGTANTLVKYTAAGVIADSGITDDGTTVSTTRNIDTNTSIATASGLAVNHTPSGGTTTGLAAIAGTRGGSMDTTAGNLSAQGVFGVITTTKSAGGNSLTNAGVRGIASGSPDDNRGVSGVTTGTGTANYGGYFSATGAGTTNYGVYSDTTGAGTNYSFYSPNGLFYNSGGAAFGAHLQIANSSAAVSDTDTARLRYSDATQKLQVSLDTAAYVDLLTTTTGALQATTLTAGSGLTGGGDLSTNRTFTVGAGTGITVNADDVAVNQATAFNWTADHSWKSHASFAGSQVVQTTKAQQTTDATQTHITLVTLSDNFVGWVTVEVAARDEAGTERAIYGKVALVYRQGGGAAIQGAVQDVHPDVETSAGLDATITVNSNDVRLSVTGLGSTTIDWVATVRYQQVSTNA